MFAEVIQQTVPKPFVGHSFPLSLENGQVSRTVYTQGDAHGGKVAKPTLLNPPRVPVSTFSVSRMVVWPEADSS